MTLTFSFKNPNLQTDAGAAAEDVVVHGGPVQGAHSDVILRSEHGGYND